MSSSDLCFISIVTTSAAEARRGSEVVSALVPVVVSEGSVGLEVGFVAEARNIERVDGPVWSMLRLTVIGIAGLWYLSRGSIWRQKCLRSCPLVNTGIFDYGRGDWVYFGPRLPPSIFTPKSRCILWTFLGSIAAPGPNLIARSCGRV
jgi:hypothetical protein